MHDAVFVLASFTVWVVLCFLVGRAAASFHRPPATWVLLAVLLSPVVALVLLLLAGDPEQARALAAKEDEIRRRHPGLEDVREAALSEMTCPRCRAAVNPVTGDGLHSPEAEPWLLLCDRCGSAVEPDA